MAKKKLSAEETELYFLDVWWDLGPEIYELLWYKGVEPSVMINELVEHFPKLYRKILNRMEEKALEEGKELFEF